jgi:hypothetical protein
VGSASQRGCVRERTVNVDRAGPRAERERAHARGNRRRQAGPTGQREGESADAERRCEVGLSHPVLKVNRMRTMYVRESEIHVHNDYINDSS